MKLKNKNHEVEQLAMLPSLRVLIDQGNQHGSDVDDSCASFTLKQVTWRSRRLARPKYILPDGTVSSHLYMLRSRA